MNKKFTIYLFSFALLFSASDLAIKKTYVEVGIASIIETKDNNNVIIDIYAINKMPIAGIQFEIMPSNLFTIDSISGGRCAQLGFELHSNNKGLLLAFSLRGEEISISKNNIPNRNILFSVYGKKNKVIHNQVIDLKTTLASKMGKKINSKVVKYIYK